MNGNQAIAKILKLEGVEWISCFPSNPLIEAVANEGIRLDMFRTERGAIMAADGYSRTSGRKKFGITITQGGTGAENAMGGIAQAYADNIPILLLPGGSPLASRNVRPSFLVSDVYSPISKHAEPIMASSQVGAVLRRAFHGMRNGNGGPMTVETPGDIGGAEVPDSVIENYKPAKRTIVSPSLSDVKDAVKIFLAAKNPVIWVGGGVLFGDACAELKELAELTGVPVYTTMQGKSAFPEDHALSLGAGSGATTLPASAWLKESDVLLGLGTSLTKTNYGQAIPPGKTIIHNTENIDEINKDEFVEVGLPGDVKVTIQMLLDEVKAAIGEGGRSTNAAARIAELRTKWMADWTPLLTSDENPLNHYRVIGEIDKNLDKANSVVTHDAGTPRDTIIPFYHATTPGGYVGWGKTTHLGFGIPLMIGAKIAHPDKFCLNFMGDAAFGHSSIDIEVSVRIGAPITTVVLNNAGMATYPSGYEAAQERFGVTNMGGKYADMAESMGATGLVVKTPDEMGPALIEAQKLNADGKTVLIDVNAGFESKRSRF